MKNKRAHYHAPWHDFCKPGSAGFQVLFKEIAQRGIFIHAVSVKKIGCPALPDFQKPCNGAHDQFSICF